MCSKFYRNHRRNNHENSQQIHCVAYSGPPPFDVMKNIVWRLFCTLPTFYRTDTKIPIVFQDVITAWNMNEICNIFVVILPSNLHYGRLNHRNLEKCVKKSGKDLETLQLVKYQILGVPDLRNCDTVISNIFDADMPFLIPRMHYFDRIAVKVKWMNKYLLSSVERPWSHTRKKRSRIIPEKCNSSSDPTYGRSWIPQTNATFGLRVPPQHN